LNQFVHNLLEKPHFKPRSGTNYQAILGYSSLEELKLHLGALPQVKYNIDHIAPLAQATSWDEVVKLCHYTNIRIATKMEDASKHTAKTPEGTLMCEKLLGRKWIDKKRGEAYILPCTVIEEVL
jgi:hypothetical protein